MSSIKPIIHKLDSVDSIYNYLRESSPTEVVTSTTPSSAIDSTTINNHLKSTKKQKKENETANQMNNVQTIQILPSGRVRYGPITVNPRKQPSKTLFTGRRSKYEILSKEEEEKRRIRRERNRIAATKCRVKRDDVLRDLEDACDHENNKYKQLVSIIQQLEQRKSHLQSIVSNYSMNYPIGQQSSMVFGNTGFLSSITETPAPPLPSHQLEFIANDDEEFTHLLQSTSVLTNSAYNSEQSNYLLNTQQQTIGLNTSSIERIINNLNTPTSYIDNNNNNTCQELFNSACVSSTCARQHSSSSEDDSMSSTHKNSFVF